jgi:hypothetical protein
MQKDKCDNYNSKYIKIPQDANILPYLNDKLSCSKKTKVLNRAKISGEIIHINDAFTYKKVTDVDYPKNSKYVPLIIDWEVFSTKLASKFDKLLTYDNGTNCSLCDMLHQKGIQIDNTAKDITRFLFGNYNPDMDETYIIYKNFFLAYNNDPYMKDHIMLMVLNHEKNKVKGSQYEILNREILEDIIKIFSQISSEYIMGHNYAHIGSQSHFHLHLIKKDIQFNYGYDRCVDDIASDINTKVLELIGTGITGNIKQVHNINNGNNDSTNYTLYLNKNNYNIRIAEFKCQKYGYGGYLLTMNKLDIANELSSYVTILLKFLNYIEDSVLYTFTLYFASSTDYLNIVIICQQKYDELSSRSGVMSFRNITGFAFISNTVDINLSIRSNKIYCDKYIIQNLLEDDEIYNILSNNILATDNFFSNGNYRYITDVSRTYKKYINKFIDELKNKPINQNPKLIIINGPIGSGKSLLYKNLKNYFTFYNEKDYVHINIDDIIYNIPYFKKNLDLISNYLKENYLNTPFSSYSTVSTRRFGKYTINDLKNTNIMLTLDTIDYENIFNEIFGKNAVQITRDVYPDVDYKNKIAEGLNKITATETLYEFANKIFKKIEFSRIRLQEHIMNICATNKLNVVIEIARLTYDNLVGTYNILKIGSTYSHDNIHYLGYNLVDNTENKKFLLRNVLIRNITEGRIINTTMTLNSLATNNAVYRTYEAKLFAKNIILIHNNYKIDFIKYSNDNIRDLNFSFSKKFKNAYPQLDCMNIDDNETLIKPGTDLKINNDMGNFNMKCIDVHFKDIDIVENDKMKLKKIMTDINNKYLLNENTSSILIYNTVKNVENIIKQVIDYFNSITTNTKLDENDIKIVLKGGLNVRLLVKSIFNYYEKNIQFNDEKNEKKQKLKSLLTEIDSESTNDNPFKNIAGKSDIDFVILLNKDKLSEPDYTFIKDRLIVLVAKYLFELKTHIKNTHFFGMEYNYKNIEFDKTFIHSIEPFPNASYVVCKPDVLKFDTPYISTGTDYNILLYPNDHFFTEIVKNVRNNYYVSYIKNINFKFYEYGNKEKNRKLDILRLKNNFMVSKTATPTVVENIGGELIDIVIEDYYTGQGLNLQNIFQINYSNNLFNFDLNVYNLDYLIKDLEHMLYVDFMYPWLNNKYEKRFNRYILLLTLKFILHISDSSSLLSSKTTKNDMMKYFSEDFTKYIDLQSTLTLDVKHPFYNISKFSNFVKSKIDLATTNPNEYYKILTTYKYNKKLIDLKNHIVELKKNYDDYVKIVIKALNNGKELYKLLTHFLNEEVQDNIFEYYTKNKYNVVQWGGFTDLYKSYKQHYLNLKGGQITFAPSGQKFLINSLKNSHKYYLQQKTYIEYFIQNILPNVLINGSPFTLVDITDIIPLGCGSFGCGIKITNSATGKSFIMKFVGGNESLNVYQTKLNEYLKETYIGYYIKQNNLPNFNSTYAYFKTSLNTDDIYFSSIDNDITLNINPKDKNGNNIELNNKNTNIKNGDLFILVIDAGENNLSNLISEFRNENTLPIVQNKKIDTLQQLNNINKQMFGIYKISPCSKVSNICIYTNHSDIKPDNMIYKKTTTNTSLTSNYIMQFIDYGGMIFSPNFFSNLQTYTPIYYGYVYDNNYILKHKIYATSPLYDIASVIYSMITIISHPLSQTLPIILNDIKIAYVTNNYVQIGIKLNEIHLDLYQSINRIIFGNNLSNIIPFDIDLMSYVNKLIIYLNMALCINRFHFLNHDEIYKDGHNNYINLDFKNFELLNIHFKNNNISVSNFITFPDLKNKALLERICNIVESNIELF